MSLAPHPTIEGHYREAAQRQEYVDTLFDRAAPHYDWICRVMSFGSGALYRRQALQRLGLGPGLSVLDVATGTGLVAREAAALTGGSGVFGLDPSRGMLEQARRTVGVPLVQARGEALPFADERFDALSMGYALRHVDDLNDTFAEYRRVLKPGGSVLIMEVTPPKSAIGRRFVKFYLNSVVPTIARIGTRSDDARTLMKYFWDTIDSCVPPQSILDAMKRSGFADVSCHCISGVFREYVGRKP